MTSPKPRDAAVVLVRDRADAPETAAKVNAHNDTVGGVLACRPRPGAGPAEIRRELMRALGKREATERLPSGERAQQVLDLWLGGEEIHTIILADATTLSHAAVATLHSVATAHHIRLILVCPGELNARQQRIITADRPHAKVGVHQLAWVIDRARRREQPRDPFPPVPGDEFPLFRARARDQLPASGFERVDREIERGLGDADRWLQTQAQPDRDLIAAFLCGLIADQGPGESLTRLRGAQTRLFYAGWLVTCDAARLHGAYGQAPAAVLDEATCAALRRYSTPATAASAALAIATQLPAGEITQLRTADVSRELDTVTHNGIDYRLATAARGIIRTHLHYLDDNHPGDPSLTPDVGTDWGAGGRLRKRLASVAAATALTIPAAILEVNRPRDWLADRGITITPFEAVAPDEATSSTS